MACITEYIYANDCAGYEGEHMANGTPVEEGTEHAGQSRLTQDSRTGDDRQIEMISVGRLVPYQGNARVHSKKQIRQIAKSIERFGFTNPILIAGGGEIIAGHGRLAAAKLLGLK